MEIATYIGLIISLVALLFAIYLFLQVKKMKAEVNTILDIGGEKVSERINKVYSDINETINLTKDLKAKVDDILTRQKGHIQRIGFHKYNPYNDTGGNLSFALVLLDGNKNGFLISSLHNRDLTRIYSKQVKNGLIDGTISEDEKIALSQALE